MAKGKAIAVVSGGLDSTTLVYDLIDKGYEVDCVSFNYGQKHSRELVFARATANLLELRHDIVDLTSLKGLIGNSALTSDTEVPEGHYAEDTMKQTVVPNRNMIMLSIACGIAVNREAVAIATGVHAGDHFVYPDCRPVFIRAVEMAMIAGNEGFGTFGKVTDARLHSFIQTPFLRSSKADIAYRALELGVPFHLTWSCYKGETNHCGRCGTCVERLEAIDEAFTRTKTQPIENQRFFADATVYQDSEYWKTVIAQAKKENDNG